MQDTDRAERHTGWKKLHTEAEHKALVCKIKRTRAPPPPTHTHILTPYLDIQALAAEVVAVWLGNLTQVGHNAIIEHFADGPTHARADAWDDVLGHS